MRALHGLLACKESFCLLEQKSYYLPTPVIKCFQPTEFEVRFVSYLIYKLYHLLQSATHVEEFIAYTGRNQLELSSHCNKLH